MSRHLVRSFLLASALSPFVNAGPCRPHPFSSLSRSDSLTQAISASTIASSVVLTSTETVSYSDTVSQDAATGTGTSIVPTDTTVTISDMYSVSTKTPGDAGVPTDLYPNIPSDSTFTISTTTYGAGTLSTAISMSSATDTLSTVGIETTISHVTDATTLTTSGTLSSSAFSSDTTATSGETGIASTTGTESTLSVATDTTSTGSETQSSHAALTDTTATSGETEISSAIGTETTSSVTADTTLTTSGTESSLAPPTDTTVTSSETDTTATTTGDASSTTTSGTSTDTTVTSKESETTTTTSGDLSTTGTDSSASTSGTLSIDTTIASSETSATTETGVSSSTTEATSTVTTATSKETDTTTTSGDLTTGTDSFTSTTDTVSTDTTAATTTSGEASSTTEATSSDTTATSKETDTTTMTSDGLSTTTATDSFTSTTETETASTDTTVTTTGTDISTTTSGEPTSTVTDTFTSTTEATSVTTLSSSETGSLTTTTSGDATTVTDSATSTTETGSTDSTTTDTATTETTVTSSETTTTTSGDLTTTETTAFSSTTEATSTTSETSSAAVPVCTPGFPISPPPQGLDCDKKGQTSGHENIISWDTDALTKSIDICYNACKNTPDCGSIVFWKDVACELWKGKPGNTDGAPTDHGWYDMKCFCGEDNTEPEPTCANNLKSPAPANKVCGKNGYGAWALAGIGAPESLEACAKSCKSNNQCTSFNFEANSVCFLYSGALEERNNLPTAWMMYELDCFCDLDKPDPEPEPETGCKLKSPSPQNKVCGQTGYGRGSDVVLNRQGPPTTLQDCVESCKANDQCTSFYFEADYYCAHYSGTVTETDGQETSFKWYDVDCFSCPSDETEPTTPTEPAPQCVNGAKEPAPKDTVCGVRGSPKGPMEKVDDWNSDTTTLEDCRDECWALGTCESFTFEPSQGCTQYKSHVSTKGVNEAQNGNVWYDISCFCEPEEEPEPVCVDDSPTDKICGVQGRPGNQCLNQLFSAKIASFEDCKEKCKTNNCDSFSFREDSGLCEVYQGRVGGTDDFASPWKWYDKACFDDDNPPSEPEPQCVNNVMQPSPKDSVCGKTGNPTGQGLEEIGSVTATSLQGCRDACNKKAGCDSFQLEEGFNCYLFKGKVGDTDARTTSEVWYDMSCFCGLEAQPTNPDEEEEVCVDEVHKTQVCGLEGRPMYECIEDITENPREPAIIKSLEACRDHCKSIGCDSIAFKKDNTCLAFRGRIGGAEPRSDFSGIKMYDMSCFAEESKTEEPPKEVCIGKPLNPLPANTVCGKPGDVNNNLLSNKRIKTDMTLAECYQACNAASDCDVFNFQNQRCELYKTKSGFSTTSVVFSGSTIQWWQPSCFCDETKTDTKDPEPVCVNNMLSPPPKNSNCGAKGSILTQGLSLEVLDLGDETSLKACSDSCKAFDGCKSFSFLEQNFCILFPASAGPTDGSETAHAYYDMSCFCDGTNTEEPKVEEPAPVCKGEPKSPLPQNTVCGEKKGIRSGVVKFKSTLLRASLIDCSRVCKNTVGCDAFYWRENAVCVLNSNTPSPSDFTGEVSDGSWWVPSCFCDELQPEKTTGPTPTCQNSMFAPAPQGLACGKTGIPTGNSNGDKVGQGTANTPLACYQLCKNAARCQTMYFHKGTGDCQLYSGTVKDTNSATTSFVWYDKGCFCDSN
ncbi:hypothetical protein FIE12Z_6875 [Fusarium flagelliforme]|uniref:Apple domain-containing protein n=1 Tax=Fusarium flagelliforme TaxID=2675880 RepID=A0A395MLX9_9HYPO|nr:hypothetical protein FIE12Z_6875 [Fusarium flagelliforme]